MGVCQSREMKEQFVVNRNINRELNEARVNRLGQQKLLLLGTGECGKSTILKQMQILHKNGFTDKEIQDKKAAINSNIVMSVGTLLRAMGDLNILLENSSREPDAKLVLESTEFNHDFFGYIERDLYMALTRLWADKGVQTVYERRSEFQLSDNAKYFLDSLDRICSADYTPTVQDVLMVRAATTGIVQVDFVIKQCLFRVMDVGGQRSERRKWIHLFDDVNAIIFISAVSEYNQVLREDGATNRMRESMELFRSICNLKWFKNVSMILFLNKTDIFREKLRTVPLNRYFTSYRGPQDYDECIRFLKDEFKLLHNAPAKGFYAYETCATDTDQVQTVINTVISGEIEKNLAGSLS